MGLCPDFLLLDGVLSGLDSLSLLERLSETMPCPPRVLYLGREDKWLGLALQRGADAAAAWNTDDEDILRLTESTAQKPLPRLAERWEADRMEIAEKYAVLLRIPEALKGNNIYAGLCPRWPARRSLAHPSRGCCIRSLPHPALPPPARWKRPSAPRWKAPGSAAT